MSNKYACRDKNISLFTMIFFLLSRNVRTKEDVCQILELATIKEADLNAVTQSLYSATHRADNLMLLEVDDHILGKLNAGDTYVILQFVR